MAEVLFKMHLESWQVDSGSYWAHWGKGQRVLQTLFDMCGAALQAHTPADDIAALQNEHVVYMPVTTIGILQGRSNIWVTY